MSESEVQSEALFLDPPQGRHRYVGFASEDCRRCGRGPLIPEHLLLNPEYGVEAVLLRDAEIDELPHWGSQPMPAGCCPHLVHQHADLASYAIDPDDGEYHLGVRPCRRCDCRKLRP